MNFSLVFGDVFRYKEKDYIFLAKTEEIIYTAQILSVEKTRKIEDLVGKLTSRGRDFKLDNNVLFCYVMLETKELKNRCAHLKDAGRDNYMYVLIEKLLIELTLKDKKNLKAEIVRKNAISIELKELVEKLSI